MKTQQLISELGWMLGLVSSVCVMSLSSPPTTDSETYGLMLMILVAWFVLGTIFVSSGLIAYRAVSYLISIILEVPGE